MWEGISVMTTKPLKTQQPSFAESRGHRHQKPRPLRPGGRLRKGKTVQRTELERHCKYQSVRLPQNGAQGIWSTNLSRKGRLNAPGRSAFVFESTVAMFWLNGLWGTKATAHVQDLIASGVGKDEKLADDVSLVLVPSAVGVCFIFRRALLSVAKTRSVHCSSANGENQEAHLPPAFHLE